MSSESRVGIVGGTVVTPDDVHGDGRVVLEGPHIDAVADANTDQLRVDREVDASGQYVLPGLVDLHGDDVERYLFPRPGERVGVAAALAAADRLTLAAGVTTKFDAVAFENAPEKNRSLDLARDVLAGVADSRDLLADHRIHARCEVTDPESVALVGDLADREIVDVVSLMAHAPGNGQFDDEAAFARRYADGRGAASDRVERVGRERAAVSRDTRRERIAQLAGDLDDAGVLLASHDDADPAAVDHAVDHGVDLCEYPVSARAARRARERGVATAMGAPNLVRGGSLWGNLDAREALDEGLVDVLCSDYRPQAMLQSIFVDTGEPLTRRVERVSAAPARAAGLNDRGALVPGARADVVIVDPEPVPTVSRAFVGGHEVYRCGR